MTQTLSRDTLVAEFIPLVKQVATRIAARLPPHLDLDDLISAGTIGLLDAITRFDDTRTIGLRKYVETRIRGAIIDELRNLDPMGRTFRRKAKNVGRARHQLEQELGRAPSAEELAAAIGMDIDGFHALMEQLQPILNVSVESLSDEGRDFSAWLIDRATFNDPHHTLEVKRLRELLERSMGDLQERHGQVLRFYFFDGMQLREIAKIFSVSESRASQLLSAALLAFEKRLRLVLRRDGLTELGGFNVS